MPLTLTLSRKGRGNFQEGRKDEKIKRLK